MKRKGLIQGMILLTLTGCGAATELGTTSGSSSNRGATTGKTSFYTQEGAGQRGEPKGAQACRAFVEQNCQQYLGDEDQVRACALKLTNVDSTCKSLIDRQEAILAEIESACSSDCTTSSVKEFFSCLKGKMESNTASDTCAQTARKYPPPRPPRGQGQGQGQGPGPGQR